MKRALFFLFISLQCIGCGSEGSNDIYKTSNGDYGSKKGNFIADFPTKPKLTTIDNQIGMDKFQIHLYRSTLGGQKIFNVEYYDYPENLINDISDEEFLVQGVNNFSRKVAESFDLEYQNPITQHGLKGQAFQLELNKTAKAKGLDGFIMGRLFRKGNRVYTITYIGVDDKNIDSFIDSFKLIN